MEDFMKKIGSVVLLFIIAIIPLVAGGGQQNTGGVVADSAAIVTSPGQLPIVKEPVTLTLGIQRLPTITDYVDNYLTKYLESNTGIKIDFRFLAAGNDGNTQFELMVSSGEKLPDIRVGRQPNWVQHGENGVFLDLNPYFEKYGYFFNQRMADVDLK